MTKRLASLMLVISSPFLFSGCMHNPSGSTSSNTMSFVIVGESNATGVEAAQELQLAINRVQTVGCKAESVGGYGAAGEGMVLGIAALINCPLDIHVIPTGFPFNKNTGVAIPVDPAAVIPPAFNPPTP